ncbi:hypothetical protein [Arthrobacter sp. JCM 19049]|uniref:hypothetical protein n=1 Tax=Arthrobacter sp. JCM 19049 TaxID=1460643 RepID=UPI000A4C6B06|nr:hypothetical protein [Arthrobacter sp. JCM 19049]
MSESIVVISGGLGTPSSSGLLGRQLADAVARELAVTGVQGDINVIELRDFATDITNTLLAASPRPDCSRPSTRWWRRRADRRLPGFHRLGLGPVQVLH